ncbi:MAG: hypothetical protein M3164_08285 [Actinomycetota bacterium]|nr:hypothetical protein [Actinomycetota bacterium]
MRRILVLVMVLVTLLAMGGSASAELIDSVWNFNFESISQWLAPATSGESVLTRGNSNARPPAPPDRKAEEKRSSETQLVADPEIPNEETGQRTLPPARKGTSGANNTSGSSSAEQIASRVNPSVSTSADSGEHAVDPTSNTFPTEVVPDNPTGLP